ncbi:CoA transferase [Niveispirillum sp. KHB5.9]
MLNHLTIIDATDEMGVLAGHMFAQLGADVTRLVSAAGEVADPVWTRNVRTVALDDADLPALLQGADILLRNGPLSGVDPADHPHLIDVVLTPFAAIDRPSTDLTLMARSGLLHIGGDPDREPLRLPGQQAHALGAIQAVIGALTALHARKDKGQRVTVSAYQSAVLANYREPVMWDWAGKVGARTGNLLVRGKSGVNQVWKVADGWVTWALVDNPGMMRAMVALMRADDMAGPLAEVDWDTILVADLPQETLKAWEGVVAAFLATKSRTFLAEQSNRTGMGLSAIDQPDDVLSSPHHAARGAFEDFADPVSGRTIRVPGPLFQTSREGVR